MWLVGQLLNCEDVPDCPTCAAAPSTPGPFPGYTFKICRDSELPP